MPLSSSKDHTVVVVATATAAAVVSAAAYYILHQKNRRPKLQPKTPVPSDIEISQDIVREVGLLSMEQVAKE